MVETTLEDWKIKSIERIERYLTYSVLESNDHRVACYFDRIGEWSLMKYCSSLQIFINKQNPVKIFDVKLMYFLFNHFNQSNFIWDWTDRGFIAFRQLINEGNNNYSYPFVIINFETLLFTKLVDNYAVDLVLNSDNTITCIAGDTANQIDHTGVVIEPISLASLKWDRLASLIH